MKFNIQKNRRRPVKLAMRRFLFWVMNMKGSYNLDFVIDMCKDADMTDEELEKHERIAWEKKDYMAFFLLCITKICKKDFQG